MTLYVGNQKVCPTIKVGDGPEINNQNKTITENGTYTADSGYTGLGTVTVNVSGGTGDSVNLSEYLNGESETYTITSNVQSIPTDIFEGGSGSRECYSFPNVTTIATFSFRDDFSCWKLSFPALTRLRTNSFSQVGTIRNLYIPSVTYIEEWAFTDNGEAAGKVILGGNSVVELAGSWEECFILQSETPDFYVPDELVSAYEADSNWSGANIFPLSEWEEE